MTTRTAHPADVPALEQLAAAAYEPYTPRIGRPPAPMVADYAAAVHAGHTWVAEHDGAVVGLLVLVEQPDHVLLENVAVHPAAQGSGVGRLLMQLAEEQARTAGFTEIRLYTNEAMTENLAYYPRHGYLETHRVGEDGFRRVYFRKTLTA